MFLLHPDIFLWDFLILLTLGLSLSISILCSLYLKNHPTKPLWKRWCTWFLGLASLLTFLLLTYGSFMEPHIIVTNRFRVTHPLAPPLRIAIVSDLHLGPYKGEAFLQRVVRRINAELPDLVLLPGDFVFTKTAPIDALSSLKEIRAPLGTYAVLGNHDLGQYMTLLGRRYEGKSRGDEIANAIKQAAVTILRNEHTIIPLAETPIALAGIDDLWTGHVDINRALSGIPKNTYTILLSHNPSILQDQESNAAHLIVSGHTHGGQIRLPFIGSLTDMPTTLGRDYDHGLFVLPAKRALALTRGVGESSPRARLFAWPEIMIVDIERDPYDTTDQIM